MRFLKPQQSGDTIVEVLVVLAVLGLALSISFATAQRSLLGARQAQEHTEALEIAQAQLEDLQSLADNDIIYGQPSDFCVTDPTGPTVATADPTSGTDPCLQGSFYHIAISPPDSDTFTVSVTWDAVTGHGTDNVSLVYRLHKSDG